MAPAIKERIPDVEKVCRIHNWGEAQGGPHVKQGNNYIKEKDFLLADQEIFDILSIKLIHGDRSSLILNKSSLVISESAARKYFGGENAMGKSLFIRNNVMTHDFVVTGVYKDLPFNSTYRADFIGHLDLVARHYEGRGWGLSNINTLVLLNKNADPSKFHKKLEDLKQQTHPDSKIKYRIQSIKDIYFGSDDFRYYSQPRGDKQKIILFSIISMLVLLIANINYILLSTAKGFGRTMEIGVRKVVGSSQRSLLKQICFESLLFMFLVFPFAIMFSELLLPLVNQFLGIDLRIEYAENALYLYGLFAITVFSALFSGVYIALFLSKIKSVDILQKRFSSRHGHSLVRRILITVQMVIFVVLFSFSGIIIKQISFLESKKTGINQENIMVVCPPHDHHLYSCRNFVNSIKDHPEIISVCEVNSGLYTPVKIEEVIVNTDSSKANLIFSGYAADENYIKTFGFNIIEGSGLLPGSNLDSERVLINQTAVRELGHKNPVGAILKDGSGRLREVKGVIEDFIAGSLHQKIPPVIVSLRDKESIVCHIAIKYKEHTKLNKLTSFVKEKWEAKGPYGLFDYFIFNDKYLEQYAKDRNFSTSIKSFTILAVIIAVLGLFGFSIFTSRQRIKEIGIRKTYGGKLFDIVYSINKELVWLTIFANIVSVPIVLFVSDLWLENYAYRISVGWMIFLISFASSIFIVLSAVSVNSIKAANSNPSDSLRYE